MPKPMRPNLRSLYEVINLPKHICTHIFGAKHSPSHRMVVGFVVMLCGVSLSKVATEIYILHVIYDMSGYFIHAVGAIPFLEKLSELAASEG